MQEYRFRHTRTGDFRLNYHMVWTTGFNRTVLQGEVGEFLIQQIKTECEKLKATVEEIYITNDSCVDTILTIPSDISIAEFLRDVKGISARYTFKKYPDLKNHCWKGKLWNGQSMVETIGVAKKMTRKRYIKNQERADQASRDIQTNEVLPKWWEL